ncbi:DUF6283 family protein [Rhizobium phage vB_RleS_L338C]|uniref:DUF6283 family protein n=1 Tax=Rhizobium phage vB_RleS_L338C TaxID=1414737 RepID=UPI0003D8C3E6|nr:DUF6283 family protein [Rhizobium phage vB_RleS_L338C]AHC30542.1 hypothetical protein L338C_125 [Rhizobium phage vB_RleS_L338C]QNH72114.1 hypothetical protein P11VFA_025 [Rhizobium phage P11VFA]
MTTKHHALPAPCKSCPYRKDVPSAIWAEEEYEKLPMFDGEIVEQVINGGTQLFLCHQRNNALCSGWLGCHGPENLLALRLHGNEVEPEVFDYQTDVPLFSSGAEAAAHGMKDMAKPSEAAERTMGRLLKKKGIKTRD